MGQAKNHPWVHSGKNGKFKDADAWQCDPGCSEILISKHAKSDLNESVLKTLDDFGIKRDVAIHNCLNKSHNGINTCYYLLKQAMKDNATLVENGALEDKALDKGIKNVSSAMRGASSGGSGGVNIRPLSAPSAGGRKPKPAGFARPPEDGCRYAVDDDSFIKDDDDSDDGVVEVV